MESENHLPVTQQGTEINVLLPALPVLFVFHAQKVTELYFEQMPCEQLPPLESGESVSHVTGVLTAAHEVGFSLCREVKLRLSTTSTMLYK